MIVLRYCKLLYQYEYYKYVYCLLKYFPKIFSYFLHVKFSYIYHVNFEITVAYKPTFTFFFFFFLHANKISM